jgi:outer membrane phospholipase A
MKKFLLSVLLAFSAIGGAAADVAFTLMPPAVPVVAGTDIHLDLAAMNPGTLEQPFAAPLSVAATLITTSGERTVTLDALGGAPVAVAPAGFAVRRYHVMLPADISGRVVVEANSGAFGVLRAVLEVQAPALAASEPAPVPATPLEELHDTAPVAAGLARSFAGRFMPNQPIYFIYGDAAQAVKFQFSFDYRLGTYRWGAPGAEKISTLRVGYTQRSVWDIEGESSPFYDSSYMPEFGIQTDSTRPPKHSWFTWMGWRLAFQHESNGKSGPESRSLNTVYLRPRFVLGDVDHWFFVVLPEIHTYVGDIEDNPAIKDYRGYGKLKFYFGRNDGPTMGVSGWMGKDWEHPTYQLDLAWPLKTGRYSLDTYLYIQYFNGYGESLRSYDEKSDALRFGVGLVR